jgi:hypothetical protein
MKTDSPFRRRFSLIATFAVLAIAFSAAPLGAQDADTFSAMLKNATLKGTWAPISGNQLGAEKADSYQVARAELKGGDNWVIVWKVQRQGQTFEYPIPSVVKFAGDTSILILDEVPIGEGKVWSARVLFHKDSYAGRWWGKDGHGGTVSGTITR